MKKKIISVFIVLVFCFSFSFNVVSASVTFPLPDKIWKNTRFNSNYPNFNYENFCSDFFQYSELNSDDYFLFIAEGTAIFPSGVYIFPFLKSAVGEYTNSNHTHIYLTSYPSTIYKCSYDFNNFSSLSQSSLFGNYPRSLCYKISDSTYNFAIMTNNGQFSYLEPNTVAYCLITETSPPPFVPSPSVLYGLDLNINETDFYNWIIDNNKLVELPSYITANKLLSFIQFYKNFGGSFSNFLKNVPDWFSYMNIVNQSADNVNVLKSSMDKLYQEYINSYWRVIYPDFSNIPTHRRNIRTNTTDTNITLITDDSNDTVVTSILRDILRGIISINNSVSDGIISIINKLDQLDFTVNVANGGGSFSAAEIWGSGDITQSSNYQALSDAFVQHGVVISNIESLQYNYLAGQTQKDSFTVSVDMPDEYINGEFTKKTITHTVDSNSKMYDTLVLFRKIIALAVILFYVVRLKLALPSLIKGD